MKPSLSPEPNWDATLRAFCLGVVLLGFLPSLRAQQFGLFTYQVVNGTTVTIMSYPRDAVGHVEIPAVIDGLPVTSIDWYAFSGCTRLTAIEVMSGGPVVNGNTQSIRFLAETDGLWCYAETSTDLIHWTTTGVTTSGFGPDGLRTASVPINVPQRFMRVVVIPRDPPPPPPDPDGESV